MIFREFREIREFREFRELRELRELREFKVFREIQLNYWCNSFVFGFRGYSRREYDGK